MTIHVPIDRQKHRAYSTIEILVCIALLGLLAAIALPRFEQAHVSANVSEARANLQALKVGIESYKADLGAYIWQNSTTACMRDLNRPNNRPVLERLTTPISYLDGAAPFYDPFASTNFYSGIDLETILDSPYPESLLYRYNARNTQGVSNWGQFADDPLWYFLESSGPDQHWHLTYSVLNDMTTDTLLNQEKLLKVIYDPTNGAVSRGSIWVVGGQPQGYGTSMATVINGASSSWISDWTSYGR